MIFGEILAGGVGSRMHMADMPKQFLPLGDKPILIHTLEKFLTCSRFETVYIGTHADWINYTEDLVGKYVPHARGRVRVVCGGENRNETIQNIIAALQALHQVHKTRPNVLSVQQFIDVKITELVSIFTPAPADEQKQVYDIIKEISPINAAKLKGFATK